MNAQKRKNLVALIITIKVENTEQEKKNYTKLYNMNTVFAVAIPFSILFMNTYLNSVAFKN